MLPVLQPELMTLKAKQLLAKDCNSTETAIPATGQNLYRIPVKCDSSAVAIALLLGKYGLFHELEISVSNGALRDMLMFPLQPLLLCIISLNIVFKSFYLSILWDR